MPYKDKDKAREYQRKYHKERRAADPAVRKKEAGYRKTALERKLQGLVDNLTESELEALLRQRLERDAAQEGRREE